jgi:hypothetical protein
MKIYVTNTIRICPIHNLCCVLDKVFVNLKASGKPPNLTVYVALLGGHPPGNETRAGLGTCTCGPALKPLCTVKYIVLCIHVSRSEGRENETPAWVENSYVL